MRCRGVGYQVVLLWVVAVVVTCVPTMVFGQASGVMVDAQGVLRRQTFTDPGGQLLRQRLAAAKASLNPEVAPFSKMRMISLNRLEEALAQREGVPTEEMRYLAGLLRVRYVFYYPETKDIVIAGPAEGWVTDASGRVVGMSSGRPVVQLQDLVVALRAFSPNKSASKVVGCSIDPTEEGLASMQEYLRRNTPFNTRYFVEGLRSSLGLQMVTIDGIPAGTHFAQVMVEADYRMKLIGIGLEQPPIRLPSYVARANPSQVGRNAMQRWFFTPDYECVRVSEDGLAMALVGDGVQLLGESEMVTSGGQRRATSSSNRASQAFVNDFTKKYPELAARSPVYAELRNLVDLLVASAFIQQEDYYGQSGWTMEFLGDESLFSVETYTAPKMVETAVNAVWKGRQLMTPIGGGVTIDATEALDRDNLLRDEKGAVAKRRNKAMLHLADGQWWWN